MKSLQEIWDKIGALQMTVTTQQQQLTTRQNQNTSLQTQLSAVSGMNAISAAGQALPWNISTVDSGVIVGQHTSLAFGPDGQPAISYYDGTNGHLKFARYNGSSWLPAKVVNSDGDAGVFTSLAFGPDGQPAIFYQDYANHTLKFARKGIFKPAK